MHVKKNCNERKFVWDGIMGKNCENGELRQGVSDGVLEKARSS